MSRHIMNSEPSKITHRQRLVIDIALPNVFAGLDPTVAKGNDYVYLAKDDLVFSLESFLDLQREKRLPDYYLA